MITLQYFTDMNKRLHINQPTEESILTVTGEGDGVSLEGIWEPPELVTVGDGVLTVLLPLACLSSDTEVLEAGRAVGVFLPLAGLLLFTWALYTVLDIFPSLSASWIFHINWRELSVRTSTVITH